MTNSPRTTRKRKNACKKLGISQVDKLLVGAKAAADALGVSLGTIRKHVQPADYDRNPKYRGGAPVGLYDPIDLADALKKKVVIAAREKYESRKAAAIKANQTRVENIRKLVSEIVPTIRRNLTDSEIEQLARDTHGGNYDGDPGPFRFSSRVARNCIRHQRTNYEAVLAKINRGDSCIEIYAVIKERFDELVEEAYPQFAYDD